MVELRKRKAATESAAPPPQMKKANSVKSSTSGKESESSTPNNVAIGQIIDLEGFGGQIETQDGEKTTLKTLVEDSKNGVVLFTYPKASTPGCTTQACLFRDDFTQLTATGFSIFGLSTDSPKSNSNFKTKQNLPYALLCDPSATLIKAIGMKKTPSGTTRGVFVVEKEGKVAAVAPGGPAATVEVVRKLVQAGDSSNNGDNQKPIEGEGLEKAVEKDEAKLQDREKKETNGDEAKAEVAAEVADTAEKLDSEA